MAPCRILMLALISLTLVGATVVEPPVLRGEVGDKEPIIRGQPLSYWLKELKSQDLVARDEALTVLAGAGEAARGAAPVLTGMLKDKSLQVRIKSAMVLTQLKGHSKQAVPVLLAAWKEAVPGVRRQILPALGPLALEDGEIMVLLLQATSDADPGTRNLATLGLTKARPAVYRELEKVLDHADPVVRRQAVIHLSSAGKEAAPSLTRMLKDQDWDTRFWAAHALIQIEKNPRAVLGVMLEAAAKKDPKTRAVAVNTLLQLRPLAKEALDVYKAALKDGPLSTKIQAADAVWHLTRDADEVLPVYREILENVKTAGFPAVTQALTAVKQLGPNAKALRVPLLDILKKGQDSFVIQALPGILVQMGPESIPTLAEVAGGLKGNDAFIETTRARTAARTLGLFGKEGVQPLLKLADHKVVMVRIHAYDALPLTGSDAKNAVPMLRKALKHENSLDRVFAMRTLGRLGPSAKDALADVVVLGGPGRDAETRRNALMSLTHMEAPIEDVLLLLEAALEDRDPLLRLTAADWLLHLDPRDARAMKVVASCLQEASCTHHALKIIEHRADAAKPALPALLQLHNAKLPSHRSLAIQALGRLGADVKAHEKRLLAALEDPDGEVRLAAARVLYKPGVDNKAVIDCLVKGLTPEPGFPQRQMMTLAALVEMGPAAKDAIPAIERQIPGTAPVQRLPWIEALAAIDLAAAGKYEFTLVEAFDKYKSIPAARLLGQLNPKEAKYLDFLLEKLDDRASHANRLAAAETLAKGGAWARAAVPALRTALEDAHPGVRLQAALALDKLEPKKHKILPVLIGILRDNDDWNLRLKAANALAVMGPAAVEAVPALRAAVRDPETSLLRFAANEALWKIDPTSALPCVFQGY